MKPSTAIRAGAAMLTACALALSAGEAAAFDYETIPLTCVVANSDGIVVVDLPPAPMGRTYTAVVRRVLAGELRPGVLRIKETAAWKGTEPEFQVREALLFLRQDPGRPWQVIGPSSEGRVPLGTTQADVRGVALPLQQKSVETYPRETFLGAIAAARQCFTFRAEQRSVGVTARCSSEDLSRLSADSPLHAGLIQQLRDAQAEGLPCRF